MTSKLIPILTFVSFLCLSESIDFCPLIKPNNTYKGVGIYHKFDVNGNGKYVMFNRNGKQWYFDITGIDGQVLKNTTISYNERDSPIDTSVYKHRFGMFFKKEHIGGYRPSYHYECYVEQQEYENKLYCNESIDGNPGLIKRFKNFPQYRDLVIMKMSPYNNTWNKGGNYFVIFNRLDKTQFEYYNLYYPGNECSGDCYLPSFVEQMGQDLFAKIEGIVDYNYGQNKTGWLLLFNIDGRPKYCLTKENVGIADECKSAENMKSLFDECFVTNMATTQTKVDPNIWLIVGLTITAVVLLIVVVIALVCYCKRRYSTSQSSSKPPRSEYWIQESSQSNADHTPITSDKTTNAKNSATPSKHNNTSNKKASPKVIKSTKPGPSKSPKK